MTLVTRVSSFFLAALGVVLAGFSAASFATAWAYLHRQVDDRLDASLAVLVAAAELHAEGVEWEPDSRELTLGPAARPDRLRWVIHDKDGRQIDRSTVPGDAPESQDWATPGERQPDRWRFVDPKGEPWRVARRVVGPELMSVASEEVKPEGRAPDSESGHVHHESLAFSVAAPLGPVEHTLALLGWFLIVLTIGVWAVAAALGRWLVRRALVPLSRMVDSARGLDASDVGWSIPEVGTSDELAELGHAFNDLLCRLRVAYERQSRFSCDASHQLRTPLTAMTGQIDVALRRDRPAEEYRRVLGLVRSKADELARIVETLLFLARAEADAGNPGTVRLDLADWMADQIAAYPAAPPLAIELDLPVDQPSPVRVHPGLLGQLVDNLLDNAVKYGGGGRIIVRVRRETDLLTITVEDDGPGIAPADLDRVFDPFYRSDRVRRQGKPGVGLGLAIARRIAGALGGSIAAASELGRGSRFELRLPADREPTATRAPIPDDPKSSLKPPLVSLV